MTAPRDVIDKLADTGERLLSDRTTRWLWRTLIALAAAALIILPAARALGATRPATPTERWAVDDAAQLLASKGITIPPFTVMVDTSMPSVNNIAIAAAYATPNQVVLSESSAAEARETLRAQHRPRRYRKTAYANAPVYQTTVLALHEVTHIAQFHYGTIYKGCHLDEGVAEAVAYDWTGTLIRRRWGNVDVLPSLVYVEQLEQVLAATGESLDYPTGYHGRGVRLNIVRGTMPCPKLTTGGGE